jgi:hypothetical protein
LKFGVAAHGINRHAELNERDVKKDLNAAKYWRSAKLSLSSIAIKSDVA